MAADHTTINVLIVDDELEACANLESILLEYVDEDINIVGIANNTKEAEKLIHKHTPDALFLDIEMPNENAFRFLHRLSPFNFEVVFVTAYDEYAVKAFKLNAVDYILKPISIPELKQAVEKLREKFKFKQILSKNNVSYEDISNLVINKAKNQRIALKDNNVIEVVDFKDIFFLEAQGSYTRILFLKDGSVKEIIMSGSLGDYEELFPEDFFYRIHKSYLINCAHVKKILKDESTHVVVKDSFTLPVSRRRSVPLIEFLKNNGYYNE